MSSIQPTEVRKGFQKPLDVTSLDPDNPKIVQNNNISPSNHQKMGLAGAISFVCGNTIGAGLFITPSSVVKYTNSVGLALTVWVLSAVISVLGAYCYVELGTSIRKSGADFAYLCYVGWFPAAFSFMSTGCLMMYPSVVAVQAQAFSEYLFQGLHVTIKDKWLEHVAKVLVSFTLVWAICAMNFFSLKKFASRFQIIATTAKILATMSIVVIGFYYLVFEGKTENLQDPFKGSNFHAAPLAMGFFQALFSYDGWDILNFGIEEVDRPRRTLPLAILLGVAIVALTFFVTNVAYLVVLNIDEILISPAIAQTFAQKTMGNMQYIMPFLTSMMLIGSLNGTIFAASRYLFAAARHGHMPSFLSIVNEKSGSPRAAIFYHSVLSFCFAMFGDTETLVNSLGFAQWLQRLLTMIALLYIRFSHMKVHPEGIKTPIVLPILFLLICLGLVVTTLWLDIKTAAVGLGFLLTAFAFYFIFIWDQALNRFQGYQKFCAVVNHKATAVNEAIFNAKAQKDRDHDEFDGHSNCTEQ